MGWTVNKTIGILAHVDAGKTTFSEQILFHTKSIRNRGRVDHKNAFLDSHDIEKDRGITLFSDQGIFTYNNSTYYLIDTPGHVDFSAEMERALQIMDYAVIIISAVEGVQGHTETVWQLLQNKKIPTFFFINKADRTGADIENVLNNIKSKLTGDIMFISNSNFPSEEISGNFKKTDFVNSAEKVVEFISERDEALLEAYLNGNVKNINWNEQLKALVKSCGINPCMAGSALQNAGVNEFLELLDGLTVTAYNRDSL